MDGYDLGESRSTTIAVRGEIGRCSNNIEDATLNSISDRQIPLTKLGGVCNHFLPVSWLLKIVRLVAAGIGSVMRLSSSSCRQSLDVRVCDAYLSQRLSHLLVR